MKQIIPWKELTEAIEPYYPKPEDAGRRPVSIKRMLRIQVLQDWFDLSGPGAEKLSMTHVPCDVLWVLIWVGSRYRAKQLSVIFVIWWKSSIWAMSYSGLWMCICKKTPWRCHAEQLLRPRPSTHRVRPKTRTNSATRRCTRPARVINGIFGLRRTWVSTVKVKWLTGSLASAIIISGYLHILWMTLTY